MELLLEKFKINNKCQLNSEDISSLTLLYLPLIGLDSFALYQGLTSLEAKKEYFIKKLVNITGISTLKDLTKAFDKLEGIGLVKTYYKKDKGYVFDLVNPLTQSEFLKEEIFVDLLETQIGKTEIEELKKNNISIINGYKDITKNFSDVFKTTNKQTKTIINNLVKPTISIENPEFNYSLFKMLFDSSFIDEELLEAEEFKTLIIKISYVYKLNEDDMKEVVFNSFNIDKRCDYASLSKYARNIFQKKYKVDTPQIISKQEDQFIQSAYDDPILRLCNDLESKSPAEILESLSKMKATPSELKIFEDLYTNTNLSKGAINFMIMLVNEEKDGVLPGYNYFEKIASTWSRAKVKTALDAYKYIEKKNSEKKEVKPTVSSSKKKKEAPLPDWYSQYEKGLNADSNDKQVNEEIAEIAKNLFED